MCNKTASAKLFANKKDQQNGTRNKVKERSK